MADNTAQTQEKANDENTLGIFSAKAAAAAVNAQTSSRTMWGDAWKRLKRNKLAMIGMIWIGFVIVVALTADLWVPGTLGSPTETESATMAQNSRLAPSAEHPFGTDTLGRDVLCRVIYGSRISLAVGVLATAISTVLGLIMGALAAYYGGIWDTIIMRLADIFLAFPYTLFVIAMLAVIGPGIQNVFIAIGIPVYIWSRKQHPDQNPMFLKYEKVLLVLLVLVALFSLYLFMRGIVKL